MKTRFHDAMTKLQPLSKELDLLVVILPDNNGSLYGDLKQSCETEIGVVSQCTQAWSYLGVSLPFALARKVSADMSFATKGLQLILIPYSKILLSPNSIAE